MTTTCPTDVTPLADQAGPCCYHASNSARLDTPSFRVTALKIVAPASSWLTSSITYDGLQATFDQEELSWIIQLDHVGSPLLNVTMGWGDRNPDGTFSFAPPNTPHNIPLTYSTTGILEGEDVQASFPGTVEISIDDHDMPQKIFTVILHDFDIVHMPMTEDRSCVGLRTSRWDTAVGGVLSGFVTVSETKDRGNYTGLGESLTLCDLIAGELTFKPEPICGTEPPQTWPNPPDSLCTETSCVANTTGTDACDPGAPEGTTGANGKPGCNAWKLVAEFDAQGVDIK